MNINIHLVCWISIVSIYLFINYTTHFFVLIKYTCVNKFLIQVQQQTAMLLQIPVHCSFL